MENRYQVKIEESVLPETYTFTQLIDAGLLDDVDEKIKVRLNGETVWQTARSYPFKEIERTVNVQNPNNAGVTDFLKGPSLIGKWNWGAFCLSWIWGIFNGIYWPLSMIVLNFIPYLGVVLYLCMSIFLGIKGNEFAWQVAKKDGLSVGYFTKLQAKWNVAGILVVIIVSFIIVFYAISYI